MLMGFKQMRLSGHEFGLGLQITVTNGCNQHMLMPGVAIELALCRWSFSFYYYGGVARHRTFFNLGLITAEELHRAAMQRLLGLPLTPPITIEDSSAEG